MKRLGWLAALAALMSLALIGCAGAPGTTASGSPASTASGPAASRATIGLTYIPDIQFAPFYVAKAEGSFQAAGVDAELRHHGAQEGLFTALAAGQEDFVIAGGDEMVQARAQGMDLVAIAAYYRAYPVVLLVKEDSPITKPADIRGKRIGVPGRYGESWFGLKVLLDSAGLEESDVSIQEIGYTGQAALTTGKVDAFVGFSNNDLVNLTNAGVAARGVPLLADGGQPPLVSIQLITTRAYLDAHPDVARGVARGMAEGISSTVADQPGAVADARAYVPTLSDAANASVAAKTLAATAELLAPGGSTSSAKPDAAQWERMVAFMKEQKLIESDVAVSDAIATDVAE